MDFFSSLQISAAGLMAERSRLDISSANLANAQSTRTAEGGAYRKRMPVFESVEMPFDSILDKQMAGGLKLHSVKLANIIEDSTPLQKEYRPGHPDADKNGFVEVPNISVMEEMTNLIQASRAYEANVTAMNTAKGLMLRTFEIGSA